MKGLVQVRWISPFFFCKRVIYDEKILKNGLCTAIPTAEMSRPEWLEARRRGIGGSAAGAAYTARMHGERSAAGKTAALQAEKKIRAGATEGMDTSTKEGRKAEAQKWKEYKKEHGEEIAGQKKAASAQAAEKTREMQKENYIRHGGAAGTAGRVFAHYTGGVTHPVQTLKSGRRYVSPQDGSYNRAGGTDSLQQAQTASVRDEQSQEKNSDEKNGLPDNLTGGRRQSSGT